MVFCTYHSLGIVERAQDDGAPAFDIVLCDEAHRTTGIERPGDPTSPFVLVHDAQRIRAAKRLYMTATPRLYTEGAKAKAASHEVEVFSMDNRATYGPEFHRLAFSRAVERNLLSDYKVVVFALSEQHVDAALQAHLASGDSEINISDAAKIVGCWRALQNPENKRPGDGPISRLTRAIAFTNTIKFSQRLVAHWDNIVGQAIEQIPEAERHDAFRCETRHVDGQHHALERKRCIEWLKGDSGGTCRILSNARCLSEGIDVPALDAVLFMDSRKSQVDIVQAVGRAMRKAEGKEYGYIVLPVAVPAGVEPDKALDDDERFAVVWGVLRALRSHDDRFDAEINKIDLNDTPTDRIIFSGDGIDGPGDGSSPLELPFPPLDLPPGAIFAKVVEKCGDRRYWETWAKDVAAIFSRLVHRIENLLASSDNETPARMVRRLPRRTQGLDQRIDYPRQRHRNDGPAHPDAAGLRGAVRALRFRRRKSGSAGAGRPAEGFRGVRAGERDAGSGALLRERAHARPWPRQQPSAPARADGTLREVLRHGPQEGRGPPRHRLHTGRDRGFHPEQRRSRGAPGVRAKPE